MKKHSLALRILLIVMILLMTAGLSACKKKASNPGEKTPKPDNQKEILVQPTDNDEEGWFSIEVLSQYSASSFTIPDGAVVTDKPEKNTLYLEGGETLLRDTAVRAFSAINPVNDKVCFPVFTLDENSVATVTSFKPVYEYTGTELKPAGEEDEVIFAYKSGHKYYQCEIRNHTDLDGNELVCVSFSDKTEAYKSIFNNP